MSTKHERLSAEAASRWIDALGLANLCILYDTFHGLLDETIDYILKNWIAPVRTRAQ